MPVRTLTDSERLTLKRMNDDEPLPDSVLALGNRVADLHSRVSGGRLNTETLALILALGTRSAKPATKKLTNG